MKKYDKVTIVVTPGNVRHVPTKRKAAPKRKAPKRKRASSAAPKRKRNATGQFVKKPKAKRKAPKKAKRKAPKK